MITFATFTLVCIQPHDNMQSMITSMCFQTQDNKTITTTQQHVMYHHTNIWHILHIFLIFIFSALNFNMYCTKIRKYQMTLTLVLVKATVPCTTLWTQMWDRGVKESKLIISLVFRVQFRVQCPILLFGLKCGIGVSRKANWSLETSPLFICRQQKAELKKYFVALFCHFHFSWSFQLLPFSFPFAFFFCDCVVYTGCPCPGWVSDLFLHFPPEHTR